MPDRPDLGCTIVSSPPTWHKARFAVGLALFVLLSAHATVGWGQQHGRNTLRVPPASQLVSLGLAGIAYLTPTVTGWHDNAPTCAPCDESGLPSFDRWAVGPERSGWSAASTGGVFALAGATWLLETAEPDAQRAIMASVEGAAWAAALTEVVKAAVDRKRPVLYTADAASAADNVDSHRSLPSSHSSVAFALATSYALEAHRPAWTKVAGFVLAGGVGAMRVAARRHFPSDVVVGAMVGAGSAIVVHLVRF